MLPWTEVVCAKCNQTTAGEYAKWGKRRAYAVKKDLRELGWQFDSRDAICPECITMKRSENDPFNFEVLPVLRRAAESK